MGRLHNQGYDKGPVWAKKITTDTTNFDGVLSAVDTDVQKALETLDEAIVGAGAHTDLTDMPSALNDDHDGRYYTETEINTNFVPYTGATGSVYFNDNIKLVLGTGNDGEVYVDASDHVNIANVTNGKNIYFKTKSGAGVDQSVYIDGANNIFYVPQLLTVMDSAYAGINIGGAPNIHKIRISPNANTKLQILINPSYNGVMIGDISWQGKNFDWVTNPTDPTLRVYSAVDPDTDNTQWISMTHNQTDGVITTGKGNLQITNHVGITGSLGVGTAIPTAKFHVVGVADAIQALVKGAATQTANIAEWQKSDGTVLGGLQPHGVLYSKGLGGYDNNAVFGHNAGLYLAPTGGSAGQSNAFFGRMAGHAVTSGYENTAVGAVALGGSTANTGYQNTAIGAKSQSNIVSGYHNTTVGYQAMLSSTSAYGNTAYGRDALRDMRTGYQNAASGNTSLYLNTTGYQNTAYGHSALYSVKPTSAAIASFADAGGGQVTVTSNSHGQTNGTTVQISGTTSYNGSYVIANVAENTFEITKAFVANETRGWWAIDSEGRYNIGVGFQAGYDLSKGSRNILIGYNTGGGLGTGDNNTIIGSVSGLAAGLAGTLILAVGSGTIRLYCNSDGDMGIGTVTPTAKLEVNGTFKATDITGSGTVSGAVVKVPVKADTGDPGTPAEGQIYVNTFDKLVRVYADSAWRTILDYS